jgi:precorrin-4/cobalt-precorrin-4 C11-methyltransferase
MPVHIVGAGPGATDLVTLRGRSLIAQADLVIYAGSLVNPEILSFAKEGCEIFDSSRMTLKETTQKLAQAAFEGKLAVRLHTGDPSIYGAIREQMEELKKLGIEAEICPGVSSLCAAAAALGAEYTVPGVSQTLIVTRPEGRTPMPSGESLKELAASKSSMAIFLACGLLEKVASDLIAGGLSPDCPAAIVWKASWPQEIIERCALKDLPQAGQGITGQALVLVGEFLGSEHEPSRLYAEDFSTGFRQAKP